MGYYVNPKGQEKEAWLLANMTSRSSIPPKWNNIPCGHLAVCLVDNGLFTAAGVAYDEQELEEFSREDHRPKSWYVVRVDLLKTVVPDLPSTVRS